MFLCFARNRQNKKKVLMLFDLTFSHTENSSWQKFCTQKMEDVSIIRKLKMVKFSHTIVENSKMFKKLR